MGDQEVKYKISGDASSLSGAQKQASQGFNEMGNKAQESHAKGGAAAEGHKHHIEGLHRVFHTLNEIIPGLGSALQACFSPIGAIVSALVIALKLFIDKMNEAAAASKKMEEEAAAPLTERLEAQRQTVVELADSQERLKESLDNASRGQRNLREETEDTTAAYHDLASAAKTVADAQKESDLAELDREHQAKLVSEEEYQQKRLAIEMKYRKLRRDAEEAEIQGDIKIKEWEIAQAAAQQKGLEDAADAARIKKVKADEDAGLADKARDRANQTEKESKENLKKWEDDHFKPSKNPALATIEDATGITYAKKKKQEAFEKARAGKPLTTQEKMTLDIEGVDYDEWNKLKNKQEAATAAANQAPQDVAAAKVKADAAENEARRAQSDAEDNRKEQREAARELKKRQFDLRVKQEQNKAIEGIEQGELSGAGVGAENPALSKFPKAPEGTPDLTEHYQKVGTAIQQSTQSGAKKDDEVLRALREQMEHNVTILNEFSTIRDQIRQLRSQLERSQTP